MNRPFHKKIHQQKGVVLVLSLVVTLFLSILLGAAVMRSQVQVQEVLSRASRQEAFYAAETGVDTAIFYLRQSSDWEPGKNGVQAITNEALDITNAGVTKSIGFYTINVVNDHQVVQGWATRVITSVGKDSEKRISRTIVARVIVESPTNFLISTLGALHAVSGSTLNDQTLAKDYYFDINEGLDASDPAKLVHVNGDAHYINSKTGDTNKAVQFGNGSKMQASPAITFPGVDHDRYKTEANKLMAQNKGYYVDNGGGSPLTVNLDSLSSLNPDPSKSFDPQIIYATGDIHISGQYSESILVVAGGNVYIDGNIVPDKDPNLITVPQIGLFAGGDVVIPEATANGGADLDVEAFVLADGQAPNSKGMFLAEGGKPSKGQLNFKGSIAVRGNDEQSVDLNAFTARNYNFNEELNKHRSIPFTPFIVNIIEWQEI